MLRYTIKRFLQSIVVVFLVSLTAFALVRLAPGSPALLMLSEYASDAEIAAMEARMGLDKPIYEQFIVYMKGIAQGDWGTSITYKQPVLKIIFSRLPITIRLSWTTLLFGALMALPLGIFAGANRGKSAEFGCMFFALLGQSMSSMWLGVLLIYIFSVKLPWLPALGTGGIKYMILPVFTMAYPMAASLTRVARSGMVDTLSEDYITATYAKGMSSFSVYSKYALRNAIIPVSTMLGLNLAGSLSGAVVVEALFSWAGIGSLMNAAVNNRDYAMVQAVLIISAFMFCIVNFLMDIVNSMIDPRLTLN
jgi:peptide/nickel transport system permease protein